MFVTTRPIADPVELLARLPHADPVAWVRDGEGLIGWGVAARLEVRGNERFSRTQRWWSTLCASLEVDDTVEHARHRAGRLRLVLVRPGVRLVDRGRAAGRRRPPRRAGLDHRHRPPARGTAVAPAACPCPSVRSRVTWSEGSRSPIEWQGSVAEAVRRIKAGELDKVVLARDVVANIDGPLDPRHLLLRLAEALPVVLDLLRRRPHRRDARAARPAHRRPRHQPRARRHRAPPRRRPHRRRPGPRPDGERQGHRGARVRGALGRQGPGRALHRPRRAAAAARAASWPTCSTSRPTSRAGSRTPPPCWRWRPRCTPRPPCAARRPSGHCR